MKSFKKIITILWWASSWVGLLLTICSMTIPTMDKSDLTLSVILLIVSILTTLGLLTNDNG